MKLLKNKRSIFKAVCLFLYIICAIVLIVESCMNGENSASQSNAVGGSIANIFNDLKGDQTVAIEPTSVNITNKIDKANVNDTYQLDCKVLPEDATYQSVLFVSSNESVASISNTGLINFLKQGEVTFSIINDTYTSLTDSMSVVVSNINATSLKSVISNATCDENNIYHINLDNKDYLINTIIEPNNTTFKDLTYFVEKNPYIEVNNVGKITPKKLSNNNVIEIKVSLNEIIETIKVVVDVDIIKLQSISTNEKEISIYPTQEYKPIINYTPIDATFKSYKLISSDENVVAISSLSFKGVNVGKANITIQSIEYENIKETINVNVLPSPLLEDFDYTCPNEMVVKTKSKIVISNIYPTYATTSSILYESFDPSIVSVDETGNIIANNAGVATIKIYDFNNSFAEKLININVLPRQENEYTIDFKVNYLKGKLPFIFTSKDIDLTSLFIVSEFISEDDKPITNKKEISYSLDNSSKDKASITNSTLNVTSSGKINIIITHINSKISKVVSLYAIDDFDISTENECLYVNNDYQFTITDKSNSHQSYIVEATNETIASIITNDKNTFTIRPHYSDEIKIIITPCYDNFVCSSLAKTFTLNSIHKYTSTIDVKLYDNNKKKEILKDNDLYTMYINDDISLKTIVDESTTAYNIEYISENENIASVDSSGKIIAKHVGFTTITIIDKYSNKCTTISIKIVNKILIDPNNTISFSGKDAAYDNENDLFSLTNGYSGKIVLNFLKESTYKNVTYHSENENVISVGQDGTLTPKQTGNSKITLTCDDGVSSPIVITLNVEVKRQNIIKDLDQFLLKIRKSLGHFGAFVVLGIFSTLTYLLYFDKKKWFFSIPLNFISGFIIAATTEIIQLYVPGRTGAWSDVGIDMSGFLISSISLTIVIITNYLVKLYKAHKKEALKQDQV